MMNQRQPWAKGRTSMWIGLMAAASLAVVPFAVRAEGAQQAPPTWTSRQQPSGAYEKVILVTDPETGCQYLFYRLGYEQERAGVTGGLTPRLDRDGRPMCGNKPGAEPTRLQ